MLWLVLLPCFTSAQSTAQTLYSSDQAGDLTYYSYGAGNCGINPLPTWAAAAGPSQWPPTKPFPLALNQIQYQSGNGSAGCGICMTITYQNTGLGANPPPATFTGYVVDQCPECVPASIDIANPLDGRWQVKWKAVKCPVGTGKLQYQWEGGQTYYIKLGVRNHAVAVASLEIQSQHGKAYYKAARKGDNFFECPQCAFPLEVPMAVRVTSVYGEVLNDVVPSVSTQNNVLLAGSNNVQFTIGPGDGVSPTAASPTPSSPTPSSPTPSSPTPSSPTVGSPTAAGPTAEKSLAATVFAGLGLILSVVLFASI